MTSNRASIYLALTFAAIFALVSLVLGFGVILSIASALIGAVSGSAFIDRSSRHLDPRSREIVEQIFRGELRGDVVPQRILLQDRKGLAKLLLTISIIFSYQSPIQRVASYTFLIQLMIGGVAVVLFFVAQAASIEVDLVGNPSLARLLADAFPMEGASAIARARFDHLFVPLASLYAISLAMFGVAFLASIPGALKNLRRHTPALFLSLVLVFALWSFFFPASSFPAAPQRLIIRGDLWGYIVIFVFIPIFCLILTGALPNSDSRQRSTLGSNGHS
ncbi:hypothetical protein KMZ68_11675 [Bradyrhizobium sediminis]|uniref:Uncharacterized protein n=1 Tax=Bradyrhizobium sediminis TaxID=2840469 RepID=A0A975NSA2_9BRAD|nr:hypothetical protein [Bradyrhizobium sediminis]QWG20438.1 hypothetical protein KMZ68_11675 [Bradyrhizobium sediminis]